MLPVTALHRAILIVSTAAKEVILPGTVKNRENNLTVVVGQDPDPPEAARMSNATTVTVLGTLLGTATDQSNVAPGIQDLAPQEGLLLVIVAMSKGTLRETVQTNSNVTTEEGVVTDPALEVDLPLPAILAEEQRIVGEGIEALAPDPAGRPIGELLAPEASAHAKTGTGLRKRESPVMRARPAPPDHALEALPYQDPGRDSRKKIKNAQKQDPVKLNLGQEASFRLEAAVTKAVQSQATTSQATTSQATTSQATTSQATTSQATTSLALALQKEARGLRVKGQNLRRSLKPK
jgi:hypothetical protein